MNTKNAFLPFGFLLIFYFFQNPVSGQQVMDSNYNKYVNSAELRIVDSSYLEALDFYDRAFQERKFPYAKDRYNAAICAAILKMNARCYSELGLVLEKGYAISNIQAKGVFDDFLKTNFGKKLIKENKSSPKNYNSTYRKALDSLFEADQYFRNKEGNYVLYKDTINKIDKSNVAAFTKLIGKYGFPTEELVGVPDTSFIPIPYRTLIVHQLSNNPSRAFDYTELIKKALEEGKIETHLAAELISKSSGDDLYGFYESSELVKCVLHFPNSDASESGNIYPDYDSTKWGYLELPPEREASLNLKRNKLGLESLKDSRIKSFFLLKDNRFDFAMQTDQTIYGYENKLDYENAIKKVVQVH